MHDILLFLLELTDSRIGKVECVYNYLRRSQTKPLTDRDVWSVLVKLPELENNSEGVHTREMISLQHFDKDDIVFANVLDVVCHSLGNISSVSRMVVECPRVSLRSLHNQKSAHLHIYCYSQTPLT